MTMTVSSHIQGDLPKIHNTLAPVTATDDFGIPLYMQKPHQTTLHSYKKSEFTSPKPLFTYIATCLKRLLFLGFTAQVQLVKDKQQQSPRLGHSLAKNTPKTLKIAEPIGGVWSSHPPGASCVLYLSLPAHYSKYASVNVKLCILNLGPLRLPITPPKNRSSLMSTINHSSLKVAMHEWASLDCPNVYLQACMTAIYPKTPQPQMNNACLGLGVPCDCRKKVYLSEEVQSPALPPFS